MDKKFSQSNFNLPRGWVIGAILTVGMICLEFENFFSSYNALHDVLGDVGFTVIGSLAIRWATMWAIAMCAIDFAGIAKIFTPVTGNKEPDWVWWLFGAWFLAASFDTLLTWWSIEGAIIRNPAQSAVLAQHPQFRNVVPTVGAAIEILVRVLMIRSFANTIDNLLAEHRKNSKQDSSYKPTYKPVYNPSIPQIHKSSQSRDAGSFRPAEKKEKFPTYHPIGYSDNGNEDGER